VPPQTLSIVTELGRGLPSDICTRPVKNVPREIPSGIVLGRLGLSGELRLFVPVEVVELLPVPVLPGPTGPPFGAWAKVVATTAVAKRTNNARLMSMGPPILGIDYTPVLRNWLLTR